jgi:hypothetical protein
MRVPNLQKEEEILPVRSTSQNFYNNKKQTNLKKMHINLFKESTTDAKIQINKDIFAFVVFNSVIKLKVKHPWERLPLFHTTDKNLMENVHLRHKTPDTGTWKNNEKNTRMTPKKTTCTILTVTFVPPGRCALKTKDAAQ